MFGQVGVGSRWEGTLDYNGDVVSNPSCYKSQNCSCAMPNGSPDDYTDVYRQFLLMFAEGMSRCFASLLEHELNFCQPK
jgi:hypothetical protein